jgi:gliding motility-associated-like protein
MKQLIGITLCLFLCFPLLTVSTGQPHSRSESTSCISYIPSAISPNGDGVNDFFQIHFQCEPSDYAMRIYNEDAQLVYESHQLGQRWDGSIQGAPAPEGTYTWILSYDTFEGRQLSRKGTLMLIR